jgi:hypothetical protein
MKVLHLSHFVFLLATTQYHDENMCKMMKGEGHLK